MPRKPRLSDGQKAIVIRLKQGWQLCHWYVLGDYSLHMGGHYSAPITVMQQNVEKLEKLGIISITKRTPHRAIYELTEVPSDSN